MTSKIVKGVIVATFAVAIGIIFYGAGYSILPELGYSVNSDPRESWECPTYDELEREFGGPTDIHNAYTSSELDCVPEQGQFLYEFLMIYNTTDYPCSDIDVQVRYTDPESLIRAVDSGEEQCEISPQMDHILQFVRNHGDE